MRRLGRFALALVAAFAIPLTTTAQACGPGGRTVLLMLDASYSMLRTVSRTSSPTRFNIAREALTTVIDRFPSDGWLALRFYGSQSNIARNDCRDTVLAVPFARASENRNAMKAALAGAHARGVTPIALALEQAVKDFEGAPKDRRIVLVTDGGESCSGNPCATALTLAAQGYVIDTVGFLINEAVAREQLQCMARVTKGDYVDVMGFQQLADKIGDLLSECAIATVPPVPDAMEVAYTAFMG